ncbi:MAG: hypothetical protein KFB96_06015 [Thiocapsa sp.]|uniref:hypothetical protein n=1 Tax=Thiocapsa sp. TaxID=2024551 RepID=UPI001BCE36D8|nr:hypothetical protein [Thiocapsa sp.]QVL50025.1 MAG: hypothetical protein KFB96_06015 [Thiocapsa sp.]
MNALRFFLRLRVQALRGRLLGMAWCWTAARRRAWCRSVADVPQEVFLFNDSIRNILLRPHAGLRLLAVGERFSIISERLHDV